MDSPISKPLLRQMHSPNSKPLRTSQQPRFGLRLLMLLLVAVATMRRMLGRVHQESDQAKFVDPTNSPLLSNVMKEDGLEDSIETVKLINTPTEEDRMDKTSILLPLAMDLWRRNISLESAYRIPSLQLGRPECSCRNATAKKECCLRTIRVTHKMGVSMTHGLLSRYQSGLLHLEVDHRHLNFRTKDYRNVLLFRNIYSALKSGYLYHQSGRECWNNYNGFPIKNWTQRTFNIKPLIWFNMVSLKVPMSLHRNRSLCHFLQEEDEKVGMRAYIDFVFNGYYNGSLALWALADAFPEVRERTRHACYTDLLSPTKEKQAIESALSFVFNQTVEWEGRLRGQTEYVGPHSTSHDPEQSSRLLQIIRELDEEVFNNEIAWVDSVLPC